MRPTEQKNRWNTDNGGLACACKQLAQHPDLDDIGREFL
jgi:hypothetical protein